MMKKKLPVRIAAATIALVFAAAAFIGCTERGNTNETTPAETDGVTTSGAVVSALPSRDWKEAEFRILGRDGGAYTQFTNFEISSEGGDTVGDAVLRRNMRLEQKYNFTIQQTLATNTATAAAAVYEAKRDTYDLVLYKITDVQAHATLGYLTDIDDLFYVDTSHPSWNQYINEQLTIADKLYYTTNDFLLVDKNRTYLNIYNRELANRYNLGYLEDLVDSNEWTMDRVQILGAMVAGEVDGLGGHTEHDSFNIVMDSYNAFAAFAYGAGFNLTKKDAETGAPVLIGADDQMTGIISRTMMITCDMETALFCNDYNNNWDIAGNIFYDGRALICTSFPSVFDTSLKEKCEFEYGILPFPKLNAEQEAYYTIPDTAHSMVLAVPREIADIERAGFFLQAITEESTETSLSAFFDVKCKIQDSYDQRCADMLDLIFKNVVYDVALFCNFGNLRGLLTSDLPNLKVNVFSSMYERRAATAKREIEEAILNYSAQ